MNSLIDPGNTWMLFAVIGAPASIVLVAGRDFRNEQRNNVRNNTLAIVPHF